MATETTPSCANCQRLQAEVDALRAQHIALQAVVEQLQRQLAAARKDSSNSSKPPALLPSQPVPRYGPMEIPDLLDEGPPDGLTLDQAIERLVRDSPALRARFREIPQAQADILSAGLRANPLLFFSADSVPYGNYTPQRQGSTGYGVTWVQPLDLNGKRRARLAVACQAKRVLEAQYQDAVRLEIDNLYTAFVDVLNARETVGSIRASLAVLDGVARSAEEQFRRGEVPQSQVDDAAVQRDSAEVALGQSESAHR